FPTLRLLTTTEGVALMDEEGTSLTSERLETLLAPTLSSPAQEGNEVHFLLYSMDETPVKGEGWRIEKDGHLTPLVFTLWITQIALGTLRRKYSLMQGEK